MNKKSIVVLAVTLVVMVTAFQNCGSQMSFEVTEAKLASLNGEDVICDPFSKGSSCSAGQGLKGSLYYLRADDTNSPRSRVSDIISHGLKGPHQLVFSKFDVPARDWEDGFPSSDGLMRNSDGQPLVEWFAFDLSGTIAIQPGQPTDYQLAVESDDGSILSIDGVDVVNNDGQHGPVLKCSEKVTLKPGVGHQIRLKYYQGPRMIIALRLLWRPWSDDNPGCSHQGFVPVPPSVLFH